MAFSYSGGGSGMSLPSFTYTLVADGHTGSPDRLWTKTRQQDDPGPIRNPLPEGQGYIQGRHNRPPAPFRDAGRDGGAEHIPGGTGTGRHGRRHRKAGSDRQGTEAFRPEKEARNEKRHGQDNGRT